MTGQHPPQDNPHLDNFFPQKLSRDNSHHENFPSDNFPQSLTKKFGLVLDGIAQEKLARMEIVLVVIVPGVVQRELCGGGEVV